MHKWILSSCPTLYRYSLSNPPKKVICSLSVPCNSVFDMKSSYPLEMHSSVFVQLRVSTHASQTPQSVDNECPERSLLHLTDPVIAFPPRHLSSSARPVTLAELSRVGRRVGEDREELPEVRCLSGCGRGMGSLPRGVGGRGQGSSI